VFVPSFSQQELSERISSVSLFSEFCCLAEVSLAKVINPEFLLNFVKAGYLSYFKNCAFHG
jgi:hypothetical protein